MTTNQWTSMDTMETVLSLIVVSLNKSRGLNTQQYTYTVSCAEFVSRNRTNNGLLDENKNGNKTHREFPGFTKPLRLHSQFSHLFIFIIWMWFADFYYTVKLNSNIHLVGFYFWWMDTWTWFFIWSKKKTFMTPIHTNTSR